MRCGIEEDGDENGNGDENENGNGNEEGIVAFLKSCFFHAIHFAFGVFQFEVVAFIE